jgi:exodeoxyribonuclease VII large subunit
VRSRTSPGCATGAGSLTHLRERVRALSPAATLARGYAVVQDSGGAVVRGPEAAPPGTRLRLRLAEGDLAAESLGADAPSAPGIG